MRRAIVGTVAGAITIIACAAMASYARADGLPVATSSRGGIESTTGGLRYLALPADSGTVLAKISRDSGEVLRSRYVADEVGIPAVAFDDSAGGLSADGDTLVVTPPFLVGRSTTEFDLVDTRRLAIQDRVKLRGSFTFDAISPDGGTIYLVEYLSPRDLTQYNVRAYGVERGRLLPAPITDPDEAGEEMYGMAVTRVMSPDGRWAYTLYDGRGEDFIHALDTERAEAVCIDLDALQTKVWGLDMKGSADGGMLQLAHKGDVEALVDTTTFEVTYPTETAGAGAAPDDGGGTGWLLIGLGAGTVALAMAWFLRRRAATAA